MFILKLKIIFGERKKIIKMNENVLHKDNFVEFSELEGKKAKTPLILVSELVGTFILVFGILLPGALGVNLAPEAHI